MVHVALVLVQVMFASLAIAGRYVLPHVPAGLLVCLRVVGAALVLGVLEVPEQHFGVGRFEIVLRELLLVLQEDVAVGHLLVAVAAVEVEVVDVLDALHVHGEALEPVGDLPGNRLAFETGDLLEVGELAHLHAVAPAFPAEPPGAKRGALPVVLDEADIVEL